ncbi:glycosyltransferase family 2 protein [Patescibacteria group bacterium]|nr:glycosyltransferase family 2 protein [Patescibacteria group bacterium]
MKMDFSIIIPTYNRREILLKCLQTLDELNYDKNRFEVIVVDDGSDDKTDQMVWDFAEDSDMSIEYFYQENKGQGNARNLGLNHAKGDVVVFIGDDIIVCPDFLKEHMRVHKNHPEENAACLGFIEWHPDLNITTFMNWLTNGSSVLGKFGGHQFAFEKLQGKDEADYNFFYTSNISLKRSLLMREKFDSKFNCYGWEDIELGFRLQKKHGLRLYYNKDAVAYHLHEILEESLEKRMLMVGKSIHLIDAIHPELRKSPSFWKLLTFRILSSAPSLTTLKVMKRDDGGVFSDLFFYALSKKYFLQGFYEGFNK